MKVSLKALLAVAVFVLAVASARSGPAVAQTYSPYCDTTSSSYNPTLCTQYSQYCQVGNINYNPTLCTQYGGYNSASLYCLVGSATYNAALCAQYSAGTTSPYCLAGTANYNAVLCAQNSYVYCQVDSVNYNASLCGQYRETIPATVAVLANASGLGCGARANVTVVVQNANGGQVPNGTVVTLAASQGTVAPPQAVTQNGSALFVYTAPTLAIGSATLTGTAGSVSGNTFVSLNCVPTAPTAVPTPVQVAAIIPTIVAPAAAPSGGARTITPPSTGDAGLAAD